MISKQEATNRAKFFAEYLFGFKTLPQIELVSNQGMEDVLKEFAENQQVFEKRSAPVSGLCMHTDEGTSAVDDCTVYINTTLCKTVDEFNSTLIHELLHYVLWWQGLDSDDGDKDFESRLKSLGLSSNYDVVYEGKKRSKKPADAAKLAEYEEAYQAHAKKSSQPFEKECPICGTVFLTTNKNRKYCDNCRVHPEQKRKKLEQSYDKIRRITYTDALVTYECEYCGKKHTIAKNLLYKVRMSDRTSWDGNEHYYCCVEHLEAAKHDHATCDNCGKSLKGCDYPYNSSKAHNYCCEECASSHEFKLAAADGHVYTCQHCGNAFISKKNTAYFCSTECSRTAIKAGWKSPVAVANQVAAEKAKIHAELTCAECGATFIKTYKDVVAMMQEQRIGLKHYCSDECRKNAWNRERQQAKLLKQSLSTKPIVSDMSLCASCKVCYKDCERMSTNFRISPKGARYNSNGVLVECPKYIGG